MLEKEDLKKLNKSDPVNREVEKGLEQIEYSPMEPPDAYAPPGGEHVEYKDMTKPIRILMDEHESYIKYLDDMEHALIKWKKNRWIFDGEINEALKNFFKLMDEQMVPHHAKEEKALFPILEEKLYASGEHSNGPQPITAIDVLEDEHIKVMQTSALLFNLLGLGSRVKDIESRDLIFDTAYSQGREVVESLRLHIFKENDTLFPLCMKLINENEFLLIGNKMKKYK